MNFLKFRGDQESGRVLCIQGPFFLKNDVGLCFHSVLLFYSVFPIRTGLSLSFLIKVTNTVMSVL